LERIKRNIGHNKARITQEESAKKAIKGMSTEEESRLKLAPLPTPGVVNTRSKTMAKEQLGKIPCRNARKTVGEGKSEWRLGGRCAATVNALVSNGIHLVETFFLLPPLGMSHSL
jgi:hypothetical protein